MPGGQLEDDRLALQQRSHLACPNMVAHISGALGKLLEAIFCCILLALLP